VLDYAPYLERRLGRPAVARSAARVLNALAGLGRPRALLPGLRCQAAWESSFDDRFDVLDRTSRLKVPVRGERSAPFLNWRFVSKPGSAVRIFTWTARGSRALKAYAVVELEAGVAHVRDVFGSDWRAIGDALCRLERELCGMRARSINCNALATSPLAELLVRLGYVARESSRRVILSRGARDLGSLTAPESWHVTDADEDQ
jgi:hypothetical protein